MENANSLGLILRKNYFKSMNLLELLGVQMCKLIYYTGNKQTDILDLNIVYYS
jgi:hypothetical protein